MIRGTTPTHYLTIPVEEITIKKVNILYAQNDELLVKKKTSDCIVDGSTIITTLTREETLLFDHKKLVEVQVVVETPDGEIVASIVETIGVDKILDDGVIE